MSTVDDVKQYWDKRAQEHCGSQRATTDDIHLRCTEVAALLRTINEEVGQNAERVLDIGCGDGSSTLSIAEKLPASQFLGVDYSREMIIAARARLASSTPEVESRVRFEEGDAMALERVVGDDKYPVVMTDRCLINLSTFERQAEAIQGISRHVTRGGVYLAIENFIEGNNALNELRRSVGLDPIRVRWHNLYFREAEFLSVARACFGEVRIVDFCSSYYLATRVVYSAWCKERGEEPDYDHFIHRMARHLLPVGAVSPVKLAVMRK